MISTAAKPVAGRAGGHASSSRRAQAANAWSSARSAAVSACCACCACCLARREGGVAAAAVVLVVTGAIDQRRRNSRSDQSKAVLLDSAARADVADDAPGPRDVASLHEVGDHVQAAISHLSPKLRAILALRYLEEMSYDELAATLEVSLGTVKSRIARAHIALEQTLRTKFPELDISRRLQAETAEDRHDAGEGEKSMGGVG